MRWIIESGETMEASDQTLGLFGNVVFILWLFSFPFTQGKIGGKYFPANKAKATTEPNADISDIDL